MKCAYCGSPSVFTVEEANEGYRVCTPCLDKRFPELRLGRLAEEMIVPRRATGKCPNCGWTESELVESGMLGCPLCYEAFRPEVWGQFGIEKREEAWTRTG